MPASASRLNITVVGGGTGSPQLLVALGKRLIADRFSIIVPVTDTGRSSGIARRALHVPAPGDLRHCLSTLAGDASAWGSLFERRLAAPDSADLDGMAVGNLALGALTQQLGDIGLATTAMARMIGIRETVLPVSVEDIHLAADLADGSRVVGEFEVRRPDKPRIATLEVTGSDQGVWAPTADAIRATSVLVIGPGSLWTSIGGVLAVPGVEQAIHESKALILFVCNTTSQPGQTDGLNVADHVGVLARLLGRMPDAVLLNDGRLDPETEKLLEDQRLPLLLASESQIQDLKAQGIRVATGDVLDRAAPPPDLWQKLPTAYHDMEKVADVVAGIASPA